MRGCGRFDGRLGCSFRLPASTPSHQRGDVPLEIAKPRFARVAVRDERQRLVGELDVFIGDAVLLEKPRQHVTPCDLDFLLDGVAGDLDDLEAIAERRGNVEEVVGRADEQTVREIELQVEVVVDERVVLRRVEHLQHRRGRIAARAAAGHFVDLVDHQHRVAHGDTTQSRCRCGDGRGSQPRRAHHRPRCDRIRARWPFRSLRRVTSCPFPAGRRSRESDHVDRRRAACARRGTR